MTKRQTAKSAAYDGTSKELVDKITEKRYNMFETDDVCIFLLRYITEET